MSRPVSKPEREKPLGWIGKPLRRLEDPELVKGVARFVDDLEFGGLLHAAVLRSPYAHARIKRIDAEDALRWTRVRAVITGKDAQQMTKPLPAYSIAEFQPEEYFLATNKVRYVGEPVLALAADDPGVAADALDLVRVEYEPLPVVATIEVARRKGAAMVFDSFGTNVVREVSVDWGDLQRAFDEADLVLAERFRLHRYSSTPLETVACVSRFDNISGELTIWSNAQMVGHVMTVLSEVLSIPTSKLRLIVGYIGGGFGIKTRPWKPLLITSCLAIKTGQYVKYVEDRREHLLAAGQSAEAVFDLKVALRKDGKILGFQLEDVNNDGASLTYAGTYASMHATLVNGPYDIRRIGWRSETVLTNQCPSIPNRGVGKPGICYALERMVDRCARKLSIDPAVIRLRNFIQPDQFPYVTPSGRVYDSGDYPRLLRRALELADYSRWRQEQERLRNEGRYVGIGISSYVHGASATAKEIEGTTVRIDSTGRVTLFPGSPDMGTGHATTFAQLVGDELAVSPEEVTVMPFDSYVSPWTPFSGTHANKFSGPDIESALDALRRLKKKLVAIAARLLECSAEDVVFGSGGAFARSSPNRAVTLKQIAQAAYQNPSYLPEGVEPGLSVTSIYNSPKAMEAFRTEKQYEVASAHQLVTGVGGSPTSYMTYPASVHVAVVEVDIETLQVKFLKYVVVADNGRLLNPLLAQGQVHGGALHGIGAATLEEFVYDDAGQLLAATFTDYLKPTAVEAPDIITDHVEGTSPRSSLGIKGIGEGEALGPLAAVANAVEDALAPFDVRIDSLPITPSRLYAALKRKPA